MLSDLCHKYVNRVAQVVAVGKLPGDPMNDRGPRGIGLEYEGLSSVSIGRHLIREERLRLFDGRVHLCRNFRAGRTIAGNEVDQPNHERITHIRIESLETTEILLVRVKEIKGEGSAHEGVRYARCPRIGQA